MMIDAARMTVPIFRRYCDPLLHMWRTTLRVVGIRYGGSSITNGASAFANSSFLNRMDDPMAIRMPIR